MDILGLPFVQAMSDEVRNGVRVFHAEVMVQPIECPFCHAGDPYRHDSREQEFADAPIRGQPVRIQFQRKRYRCRGCRKTFFEPLKGFSTKRNMTQRLVHYIARDSLTHTFADVAKDVAVDVQTVRSVFLDFSEWLREHHPIATPRIMGIDEAKRAKLLCTVLIDLDRHEYFDMLPSRKAKPLNDYLRKLPDKDRVEVVTMDLHQGFVMAIAKHLPKAVRVADHYHVARFATGAFDKVHTEIRKGLPAGERLAMFRKRSLLGQRGFRLSDEQRATVAETLKPFPLLQAAYHARESFLTIYASSTRQQAANAISAWLEHLPAELDPYFRALISAVTHNREIILNYFDHKYTNALTEAQNGISKLLQHNGRGYGFEVMRVKLLYGKRGQVIDLSDYDADDGFSRSAAYYGKAAPSTGRRFELVGAFAPATRVRHGPKFARVSQLADAGYYDLDNPAITDELTPLLSQFAASA